MTPIKTGYEIPEELYEESLTPILAVLDEKEKPRLTRWGAIAYEYALEKALVHSELSDKQRDSIVHRHFSRNLLTEELKKAFEHYEATLIFDENELIED